MHEARPARTMPSSFPRPPRGMRVQRRKRPLAWLALAVLVFAGAPLVLAQTFADDGLAAMLDAGDRRVRVTSGGDLARVQVDRENRTGDDLVVAMVRGPAALAGSSEQGGADAYARSTFTRLVVFEDLDGNGFPSRTRDRMVADVPLRNLEWEALPVGSSLEGHRLGTTTLLPEEAGGGALTLTLETTGTYADTRSPHARLTGAELALAIDRWQPSGRDLSFALVAQEREGGGAAPLRPDTLMLDGGGNVPLTPYLARDRGDARTVVLVGHPGATG